MNEDEGGNEGAGEAGTEVERRRSRSGGAESRPRLGCNEFSL
jgi:hypothetical protein